MDEKTKYTIYGALFGACFPIGSIFFLYVMGELADTSSLAHIIASAHKNSLLFVIDTAPFFLGLFARFAGIRQDKIRRFSQDLERQVEEKTESLRLALEESKKANEMIAHLAEHDSLTNLLNRRRFERELEKWGQYALRYGRTGTLVFVDLDKFKFVNDTYGHHAGDQYLTSVAELLRKAVRTTDTVARWGGDEFALLLPETTKDSAIEVANKLLRMFNDVTFQVAGRDLRPSASIGMALFPDHGNDFKALVVYADAAMYEAKAAGRNCWRMYSSSPKEMQRVQEQIQWEGRLRRALENDQFLLFYQPVVHIQSGVTVGYEALLRMEDRDGQLISPGAFLESAERFGLAPPIDFMVIRKAARKLASLQRSDLWISLNLSPATLQEPKLFDHIQAIVAEHALAKGQLLIEITEAAAVENLGAIRDLAARLSRLGIRIVLDDVSAGSPSYLQQLPVDMIKVKGSLIRGLNTDRKTQVIVEALTAVAHSLTVEVAAKFVEDGELIALLRTLNIDYAQGFAIGKPMESIEQTRTMG